MPTFFMPLLRRYYLEVSACEEDPTAVVLTAQLLPALRLQSFIVCLEPFRLEERRRKIALRKFRNYSKII